MNITLPFENNSFYAIKEYDIYLKLIYGNYMEYPPIEERKSRHGIKAYWK
jgi:lipopolysaccharide cholinephosphotransferase